MISEASGICSLCHERERERKQLYMCVWRDTNGGRT